MIPAKCHFVPKNIPELVLKGNFEGNQIVVKDNRKSGQWGEGNFCKSENLGITFLVRFKIVLISNLKTIK